MKFNPSNKIPRLFFGAGKYDRKKAIGRPYIYLATDTASQLITGMYITFEPGENAVLENEHSDGEGIHEEQEGNTVTESEPETKQESKKFSNLLLNNDIE